MDIMNNFGNLYLSQILLGLIFVVIIIFILNVVLLLKMKKLNVRSRVFFEGKDGKNLEELMFKNMQGLKTLDRDIQELYSISNKINALAQKSIHRTGLIRFNPFKDIGGDQSFSLALLDGKNSGITFSSLHTREGTRVYVKPIIKGKSEKYTLTEEEKQAVQIASDSKVEKSNL